MRLPVEVRSCISFFDQFLTCSATLAPSIRATITSITLASTTATTVLVSVSVVTSISTALPTPTPEIQPSGMTSAQIGGIAGGVVGGFALFGVLLLLYVKKCLPPAQTSVVETPRPLSYMAPLPDKERAVRVNSFGPDQMSGTSLGMGQSRNNVEMEQVGGRLGTGQESHSYPAHY